MNVLSLQTLDSNMATYKEARRYGTILVDSEYDSDRIITINHKDLDFTFHLHHGEVIDVKITTPYKQD